MRESMVTGERQDRVSSRFNGIVRFVNHVVDVMRRLS